tara:strand:+ start:2174 stop:3235 length:1062 start_codon:yes stop_codon:yes gene_type:complete
MEDEAFEIGSIITIIFGEPGMAKTSLAYTSKEPLLLDFDKGAHRAIGRKNTIVISKWEDVDLLLTDIEKGNLPINPQTLIIDTAGTMLDDFIAKYVIKNDFKNRKKAGEISLQGYGALKNVANQFFSRVKSLNVDLIFICHTEQFKDGDEVKHRPKMTGGSYDILIAKADMVGYMESKNNKRTLNFNPTDRHIGKNTAELPMLEIPHYNDASFQGYMEKLIQQTKNKITSKNEAQEKAIKELNKYKIEINELDNVEEVPNELFEKIQQLSPSYKFQLNTLFEKRYTELWEAEFSSVEDCGGLNKLLEKFPEHVIINYKKSLKPLFAKRSKELNCEYVKDVNEYMPLEVKDDKK